MEDPPEYEHVIADLVVLLGGWPGKLIAIDGRDHSGKSTLARFLAWRFGVPMIETDLFLVPGAAEPVYRRDEIARIIGERLTEPRPMPVIVEGIAILRLLDEIGRTPDYHVLMVNTAFSGGRGLSRSLNRYEKQYAPKMKANRVITHGVI